jgi:hypothetical protein
MSIKQRVLKVLGGQYILLSNLTFDLLTSKSIWVINSLGCTRVLSLKSVKQRVLNIWAVGIFLCEVWPIDLNINRIHWFFQFSKFDVPQAKGSWVIEQSGYSYVQFDLDLWLFDLKVNRGHWFLRIYQCTKYYVLPPKDSEDLRVSILIPTSYTCMSSLILDHF